MKATEARLLEFLKRSPQLVIPIYQRTYSWTERECRQLWNDIVRTGRSDRISAHFVGSIVYIEQSHYQVMNQSSLLVIDGQQRLTTVMLFLEALARRIGENEPIDGFSARKLRDFYLVDPREEGELRFKLLLTQTDKQSLLALMQQKDQPPEASIRITNNFSFFQKQIEELGDGLTFLCKGLAKLMIVDIVLFRDQDNPQLIFESMNSTGRELSQADLIRNYILMGLEQNRQRSLYEEHWRPMEIAFGQEAYGIHFDGFMRHYLTFKTGDIPNVRAVYEAFKGYARTRTVGAEGMEKLVADIHTNAKHYCAMALDQEPDNALASAFRDLRELRVDVAFPFLLELYCDYSQGRLIQSELLQAVRIVESYVFRRSVCAIPTNSLNKTFASIGRALKKERYLESIVAHFQFLRSYRRFPADEEFKRELSKRDLYNFPRRSYWLRRFENDNRKEHVPVDEYTIEHILPQNERLSRTWQEALGSDWRRIQDTWVHTLGNLTLTGYNAEYGDRPFLEKRDMRGGFRESPLRLNQGLGSEVTWNEATIRGRAAGLSNQAVSVWELPSLSADVLEGFRSKPVESGSYTLDDHAYLAQDARMRSLFEMLRKEVLALDPCVSEEILKLYVAYKAETNFVDVVPQKFRLRLSLNLHFHEVHDPKKIARDVTRLGRWGNGDVEVRLSMPTDLPYVMGLVRQAFEKQMGGGETET